MTRPAWLAVLTLAALAACDRAPTNLAIERMSDACLNQELQRCRALGLKTYDDKTCRKAQQERTARFYAKPSEAGR